MGIKIYTIGVGKKGGAPIPIIDPVHGKIYARNPDGSVALTRIDEDTLKRISAITMGKYFRANDEKSLSDIYGQIDQLEKSKIKASRFRNYSELFPQFVWLAFIVLLGEILVSAIFLKIA